MSRAPALGIAAAILAGCGGSQTAIPLPGAPARIVAQRVPASGSIQHVIVVVQENRSFDNLFSGFPKANAPDFGYTSKGKRVALKAVSLAQRDLCPIAAGNYFPIVYRHGKMDGWNLLHKNDPLCAYTHVERGETRPYWRLATRYALGDAMFSSTRFDPDVEGLYLIAPPAN